jgi:hypothetical protein
VTVLFKDGSHPLLNIPKCHERLGQIRAIQQRCAATTRNTLSRRSRTARRASVRPQDRAPRQSQILPGQKLRHQHDADPAGSSIVVDCPESGTPIKNASCPLDLPSLEKTSGAPRTLNRKTPNLWCLKWTVDGRLIRHGERKLKQPGSVNVGGHLIGGGNRGLDSETLVRLVGVGEGGCQAAACDQRMAFTADASPPGSVGPPGRGPLGVASASITHSN